MRVSPLDISTNAAELEKRLQNKFFMLLYLTKELGGQINFTPSPVEWQITMDCLDHISYRYADFYGLLAFTVSYRMRNPMGRTFFARNRLPIYLGLVGYDCGLRSTSQYPTITYWNSISMIDAPLGSAARVMYMPKAFYEVNDKSKTPDSARPTNFLSWMMESAVYGAESLFLQKVLAHTFEGSCWGERSGANEHEWSLILNNRFCTWRLLRVLSTIYPERVEYNMTVHGPHESRFLEKLRRCFMCRDAILEHSSYGGKAWYATHFALLRLLGSK